MDARRAAYTALGRVAQGAYSSIAIGNVLAENELSDQDKALASAIFYGVLERERELDSMLRPLLTRSLGKLEKNVLMILRMGLYQLAFMDKIPASAAVNEAVALAKAEGYRKASGLVNAVLRSYLRQKNDGDKGAGGEKQGSQNNSNNNTNAVPEWMSAMWRRDYGDELAAGIVSSIHGKPPVYARINSLAGAKLSGEGEQTIGGVRLLPVAWLSGAAQVLSRGGVEQTDAYRDGLLHTQDTASQLCCMMAQPAPDTDILDVCAAPGGKSFTMAELAGGSARIISCDLHPHRVGLIAKGAQRLHIECIKALRRDALAEDRLEQLFDLVLCDVPCSGLGVIRRKPDIMKKTEEELADLPQLQYSILESSAAKVKPGGVLMYSTCTLSRAENGEVVERFLKAHPEYCGEALPLPPFEGGLRAIDEPDWQLTLFPQRAGSDGFFMARMRRKAD